MGNEFILGQGQGHELELAIRRNGGTTTDVQWLCGGGNFGLVMSLARGEAELVEFKTPLLNPLSVVVFAPANAVLWVASQHLIVKTNANDQLPILPISFMSPLFQERYLGKVEGPRLESALRPLRLQRRGTDNQIIKAVGSGQVAEVTLQEMFYFLMSADPAESFIFYIRDVNDELGTVTASHTIGGWRFGIFSTGGSGWNSGFLVVVREN